MRMFTGKISYKVKLVLIFIFFAYCSILFHELGHWTVGEILGIDMSYSLNNVAPKNGGYINQNHFFYVLLGGPLFTIFLSFFFLFVIKKYKILYFYPIVFFNFILRLFPLIISFNMQDEAKISEFLGVGKYTFAIISLTLLLLTTLSASYLLKLNYKDNIFCSVISIICIFLILLTDSFIYKSGI